MADTSVIVVLECRGCGKQEEKELHVPPGIAIPKTFQCKDCAVKTDKRGHKLKARTRKSLSLDHVSYRTDRFAASTRPAGMTGTILNPGTAELPDIPTLQREAKERNKARRAAERRAWTFALAHPALSGCLDATERAVLELRISGNSYSEVSEKLILGGIQLSKAGAFKAEKRAIEKVLEQAEALRVAKDGSIATCQLLVSNPLFLSDDELQLDPAPSVEEVSGSKHPDASYVEVPLELFPKNAGDEVETEIRVLPQIESDDLDSESCDYVFGLDRDSPKEDLGTGE